jgi:superfamily II DNA or RNA helicase
VQIIENKGLLLNVRDPSRITTVIPKAKELASGKVLVKWGLEEAQVLKNLRIKNVPSPIIAHYDWPGMYTPFAHQRSTAEFLTLHRRAFCFNEQGTGKTGSVIWAADYLLKIGAIKRVLVLCPLSVMQAAWGNDLFTFAMHRTCAIAHSYSKEKRFKAINSDAEFVICNFDGLEIVKEEVKKNEFDLIVVDECFVAGTKVKTQDGYTPIESLQTNDIILTSNGAKRIKRLIHKTSTNIVSLELSNGKQITCTAEHPFFTDIGWVTAENLEGRRLVSDTDLSYMRNTVHDSHTQMGMAQKEEHKHWADLLSILRSEEIPSNESGEVVLQYNASRAEGDSFRLHTYGSAEKTFIGENESFGSQTKGSRRQWVWDDTSRNLSIQSAIRQLGMELPSSIGEEAARLSNQLQVRFCESEITDWFRSGWELPQYDLTKNTRCEEGGEATGTWVVGVSHKELSSPVNVYNVEVDGTPNYYVGDGYLVHNCNAYKNVSTKRFKTLMEVIKPSTWVWMLTGTPASQSPEDAYGLAKVINPAGVPKFKGAFKDMVMHKITTFKWVPKPSAETIVHAVLQPAIRFTKEECLDLPDMTYVTRDVPLTAQQHKYYEALRKDMMTIAAGEEITTVNAAANLNKLLQLSCGAVYADNGEIISFDASHRLSALREVIDEASHKVIVFAPFRHAITVVADELQKAGIPTEVIHGGVSATKRAEIFNRFQKDLDPQVLVIQPQAAAHGVTLHAANVVVWWGPITSIETYLQANARVHRAGQRNPSTVVHLQGSPVERRVYKMLSEKVDIHSRLVDLYKHVVGE